VSDIAAFFLPFNPETQAKLGAARCGCFACERKNEKGQSACCCVYYRKKEIRDLLLASGAVLECTKRLRRDSLRA